MPAKKKAPPRCRANGCTNDAHSRGLCPRCLSLAYHRINGGSVTDEQLVKAGILLPRKGRGRSRGNDNPLMKAIDRISK